VNILEEKAIMGIGMIMPQIVEEFPCGHMWIYWSEEGNPCPYIGYYPVRGDIPPSVRRSRFKMLRYLACNSVRGVYQIDSVARDVIERNKNKIFRKEWEITTKQLKQLKSRCDILKEGSYKLEGRYSWDRNSPHSDNCSSWVIKIVCHVMENPFFLTCSSHKQLSVVKKEVKWDFVPEGEVLSNVRN